MSGRSMNIDQKRTTAPVWTNDFLSRDHLIPGGTKLDAAQFLADDGTRVTVGAGGAASGATSVPVAALTNLIPNGTVIDFGSNKFARLTAAAASGATSLTVAALGVALIASDTAIYAGTHSRAVPSGTVIGRTLAERNASTGMGPADAADDEIYILAFEVDDPTVIADAVLVRHNVVIKENFLPGWSGLAAGVQTAVRARYRCIRGAE